MKLINKTTNDNITIEITIDELNDLMAAANASSLFHEERDDKLLQRYDDRIWLKLYEIKKQL